MTSSFYWYDYETTGIDPRLDRAVQFAGQRTTLDFEPIGPSQIFYCRLHPEVLPHPEACLVTGISPQLANAKGLSEAEFIDRIHAEFSQPGTCVVGYNSLRFDDEFTRNLLYRNFFDPYAREWKSGNSRWDLIDVVRMAEALRPEGMQWPKREDGAPSFRLEDLTAANGLVHESAHDALSDVLATIALARQLKAQQPKLFQWAFELRDKNRVAALLDLKDKIPLVHISGKYPATQHSLAVVMPLAAHPTNGNGVVAYDLSVDPADALGLSVEEICSRVYTSQDDLPVGITRIPLKTIHRNKSPMLAPLATLTPQTQQRLKLDLERCMQHREKIMQSDFAEKVTQVFSEPPPPQPDDPDLMLYSGGFFSNADRQRIDTIRRTPIEQLAGMQWTFEDPRLETMLFRYRARNAPETLDAGEKQRWLKHCQARLTGSIKLGQLTMDVFFERLDQLITEPNWTPKQAKVLERLLEYGEQIVDALDHEFQSTPRPG